MAPRFFEFVGTLHLVVHVECIRFVCRIDRKTYTNFCHQNVGKGGTIGGIGVLKNIRSKLLDPIKSKKLDLKTLVSVGDSPAATCSTSLMGV